MRTMRLRLSLLFLITLALSGGWLRADRQADVRAAEERAPRFRTLDDRMQVTVPRSLGKWRSRASWLREHILASAGLLPMPERTPLGAVVFGGRTRREYRVSKVYFESLPGVLVTGNLYEPIGRGPFPAIVSPHGHWPYGRFENSPAASVPGRAINLARQGFIVFTYDMVGYNDNRWLPHTLAQTSHGRDFGGRREQLWGLSLGGLQLWNSIRAVDFLESLPNVDRGRIGATGASGGGTQTFLLAAVDDRIAAAAPVNMISLQMQGGCLCENMPGLRVDTHNVELAALIAPRPLLMVSATGDWTRETMEREYPAMRGFYDLFGAGDRVHAVRVDAGHNFNRESREAVYAWMARWLGDAPAGATVREQDFEADPLPDVMVFADRRPPAGVLSSSELTERWIGWAEQQLAREGAAAFRRALLHALGSERLAIPAPNAPPRPIVLVASEDAALERALARAGHRVRRVSFTRFDAEAAAGIRHFEAYNRTAASVRVADLVRALASTPGAALIADGDAGPAALLAAAVVPVRRVIIDIGGFDVADDDEFLARLDIPGIRRAGDFRTAVSMAGGHVIVHNGRGRFLVEGLEVVRARLSAGEIVRLLGGATLRPPDSPMRGGLE